MIHIITLGKDKSIAEKDLFLSQRKAQNKNSFITLGKISEQEKTKILLFDFQKYYERKKMLFKKEVGLRIEIWLKEN